jgi:hypothetical protein
MNQSVIFMITGIILLLCMVGLYYYYYYLPGQTNVGKYQIPILTTETTLDEKFSQIVQIANLVSNRPTLMVPKLGYGITFTWEMYIPNLSGNAVWHNSYNIVKPIFSMQDSPQVGYNPKKNYLSVITKYRDNPFYAQFSEIKIPDLKLQKWCKYTLAISGRNIQIWIDGVIIKTEYLPSLPVFYDIQSNITIGQVNNNFNGKIRNLTLYPYPLSYNELQTI